VGKDDPRLVAYGAVDELSAQLGLARALDESGELAPALVTIQETLFVIGSQLAAPRPEEAGIPPFEPEATGELEGWIDEMEGELPPLTSFILPGGSPQGAALQLARTVCRRAEREVVALSRSAEIAAGILVYLNRLSDFLFVAARLANRRAGAVERPWTPRAEKQP